MNNEKPKVLYQITEKGDYMPSESDEWITDLQQIIEPSKISMEPTILHQYSQDNSTPPYKTYIPRLVIFPENLSDIQKLIKFAREKHKYLVPLSSGGSYRRNADSLAYNSECIVIDLSHMNKIVRCDRRNRVVFVEPGVTYAQLIKELAKNDLRPLMPLHPRADKSVLASALEREPPIIPRYHWDASDPLLNLEIVFGTGDLFRTGSAAGPGTLEEQWASGQAQKCPPGPSQFSLYRTIQGAQGSFGIVTWATLKAEIAVMSQKVFYFTAAKPNALIPFISEMMLRRIGDEIFFLNKHAFAALHFSEKTKIHAFLEMMDQDLNSEWILTFILAGKKPFGAQKMQYQETEMRESAEKHRVSIHEHLNQIDPNETIRLCQTTCETPWTLHPYGGSREIFFLTTLDKVELLEIKIREIIHKQFSVLPGYGIYVQPLIQGGNCHMEIQLYYDPSVSTQVKAVSTAFTQISKEIFESGGHFHRPYGEWASLVFNQSNASMKANISVLKKLKDIFDPDHILHPGVLCFPSDGGAKN